MARIEGLLDSNVLIAALVETHEHHLSSLNLLLVASPGQFAVAAHSHAEAYSTLTRGGARTPFRFKPVSAMAALESLRAVTVLLGLTAAQTFEAIRDYARGDGIGPRLYDRLIGEVAIAHAIPVIITWNEGHMRDLFPNLTISTPPAFIARTDTRSSLNP